MSAYTPERYTWAGQSYALHKYGVLLCPRTPGPGSLSKQLSVHKSLCYQSPNGPLEPPNGPCHSGFMRYGLSDLRPRALWSQFPYLRHERFYTVNYSGSIRSISSLHDLSSRDWVTRLYAGVAKHLSPRPRGYDARPAAIGN